MPTLEDLKGYAERATGLRRPGKRKAMDLALCVAGAAAASE